MVKALFFSSTAKDSYKSFLGNFISSLCGFLIITLLTRNLSVDEVGLFITALTFTQLVTDLFELGINPASINFLSKDKSYLKVSFILKSTVAIIIFALVFWLAEPMAEVIFKNETIIPFIQVSAFGILFLQLLNWGQTIFQTENKFGWASTVISSTNVFRLIAAGLLIQIGVHGGLQNYLAFHLALIFSLILFFWKFRFSFLKIRLQSEQFQKILRFGLPTGLGFGLAAIYTRLDQIFVFRLAGQQEAAMYGLATRLIIIVIFAITAFNSAIVIRFAALEVEKFNQYFKKTYFAILGLIGCSILGILVSPILIKLFFGTKFAAATVPFQILMFGIIFFCLALPLQDAILYRFKKPFFSFWLSLISVGLTLVLLQELIPIFGGNGAAVAMSLVYLVQLIITLIYFWKLKSRNLFKIGI